MTSSTGVVFIVLLFLLQPKLSNFKGIRIIFPDEVIKPPIINDSCVRDIIPDEVIKPPIITDYHCGYPFVRSLYMGGISNGGPDVYVYYINKTAERLKSEAFKIDILDMYDDAISNMTYWNETYINNIAFDRFSGVAPAGGEPAEKERAQYMAQLGVKKCNKIEFFCDGVLINRHWVLSAAHCFAGMGYDLNFLRLGDYNINQPISIDDDSYGKKVEDYYIDKVIFHPEYNPKERYHDLALIPLPRKTPDFAPSINPVCLPWNYINEKFQGREVVLTGWGATQYGGRKIALLQQVKLKVFDASVCQKSYSKLPKSHKKHPKGLTDDNILCVGWEEDGKDACNGDSGAPIVLGEDKNNEYGNFVLAGIVSGGYGCGLKEYPGLYIPINKPKYLRWIKEIAFKEIKNTFPDEDITQPNISDYRCGRSFSSLYFGGVSIDSPNVHIYYINKTAEKLMSEGFRIDILDMYGDAISNMTFSNGSSSGNLAFETFAGIAPAGGKPAERERAEYMAQLGVKKGDKIQFLCDGVLINRHWVLTAAHCFVGYNLNILRLGDYDISIPAEANIDEAYGKRIEDYVINDVIFHPDYNPKERYHDLALILLPRRTPDFISNINPVCLPWHYINEDLQDWEVVLTGWGATKYGGRKTSLLQQVKLKVFNASVCQNTYTKLPNFYEKHPKGLANDDILCVGWDEDGKDACNGDSGAPIVLGNEHGAFTLVGIVSGGYGCGSKEYPGLYTPINKPKYLRWIKEVAFNNYD